MKVILALRPIWWLENKIFLHHGLTLDYDPVKVAVSCCNDQNLGKPKHIPCDSSINVRHPIGELVFAKNHTIDKQQRKVSQVLWTGCRIDLFANRTLDVIRRGSFAKHATDVPKIQRGYQICHGSIYFIL